MSRFPENEKTGEIGLHPTKLKRSCQQSDTLAALI